MPFGPNRYVTTFLASFETGEQGNHDIYFPHAATILQIRTQVVKALADTDAGTATLKNAADAAMANGATSHAASAAFGDKQAAVPTTNNVVAAGSFARVTTAKSTAGGRILVELEYKLNP